MLLPGIGAQRSIKVLSLKLARVPLVLPRAKAADECLQTS